METRDDFPAPPMIRIQTPHQEIREMPTISRFYGIIVFMNYNDHQPPHFHARYQDQEIIVEIESGTVEGRMSKRALRMVLEWLDLHQEDLMANWELARQRKALNMIQPLQ